MNILSTLLGSAQGGAVQQAAQQFGLNESDTQALLTKLLPALAGGVKKNAAAAGGLEGLTQALAKGNHQRYLDDPAALRDQSAVTDGNAILGHLLGSKDVSRRVADHASTETGIDVGMIKKFLPLVAAATMGALSKETAGGANLAEEGSGGVLGKLGGLLDTDGDGQIVDNLLSLGKKLF
jgi:hypothetical protein